ncbi:hypothetical protein TCDM_04295 [Trypanosoma cruzi Dm28c]|uniref:Uncharacterized protein n=1 Tax=Trypanosoma cruzi Dm28c TaxID=1416333 RepID=V5BR99_TRYCR|nr:hypothetical protein TCDM_04295 [Trypanosoma cruzi Dm28c]PBJ81080.1 hypothetical protein BCY84_00648 [Trypanosoma cruzi cruzi]
MTTVDQVVVYADVRDPQLLNQLTAAVSALCKDHTIHSPSTWNSADPLWFLNFWEKERDDVWTYVNNKVPILRRFECFVTDSKDQKDGVVAYALYHRQMPVLSLVTAVTGIKEKTEVNEDWITTALYRTVARMGCSSPSDAIAVFFTFPKSAGKVLALEGECRALVTEQCRLLRDYILRERNIPVELVGAGGCDLRSPDLVGKGAATAEEEEEEEEESALYASLIDDLLSNPEFLPLREVDPQLHGALCALNRHHNLRLLRYRLQRGIHVILSRPMSFVLEELLRFCGPQAVPPSTMLEGVVKSIQNFEHHWLELPRPEVILIRVTGDTATNGAANASLRWTACLWDEGQTPALDTLSSWHVVTVGGAEGEHRQTLGRLHDGVRDAASSVLALAVMGNTSIEGGNS